MKQLLILLVLASSAFSQPLISESYGKRFTRSELSNGEWETVEKAVWYQNMIWVYSKADRKIARFDSTGSFLSEICFPSIGRSNYLGDDFTVRGSSVFFLNSIDGRIEQFSAVSGAFERSIPFDSRRFYSESLRSCRIISKIALVNDEIILGTECVSASFDIESGKFSKSRNAVPDKTDTDLLIGNRLYDLHEDSLSFSIDLRKSK